MDDSTKRSPSLFRARPENREEGWGEVVSQLQIGKNIRVGQAVRNFPTKDFSLGPACRRTERLGLVRWTNLAKGQLVGGLSV
ncbi:hypothetical protein J2X69_000004 [Algoriphagus sp. 4150]|nr:hypothetical protein [Algoriphagus sp. 4150]